MHVIQGYGVNIYDEAGRVARCLKGHERKIRSRGRFLCSYGQFKGL